jgi:hypothetical protein
VSPLPRDPGTEPDGGALRGAFLRWQCRVRQMAVRENAGRPDAAIAPELTLPGRAEPMGRVITVLNRAWAHSRTPELQHLCRAIQDPALRREKALQLLAADYFQRAAAFADTLTATFPPASPGAAAIAAAGECALAFDAYSQRFELACAVRRLDAAHPLHQATWWHNLLFNPELHPDTVVLAFTPDWARSSATPG